MSHLPGLSDYVGQKKNGGTSLLSAEDNREAKDNEIRQLFNGMNNSFTTARSRITRNKKVRNLRHVLHVSEF